MSDDDPVPKLPRGRLLALDGPSVVRILMLATMLVAVIVLQKPCGESVARMVGSFDTPDAAPAPVTPPPMPAGTLIDLRGKTDEQIRLELEAAARAAAGSASSAP